MPTFNRTSCPYFHLGWIVPLRSRWSHIHHKILWMSLVIFQQSMAISVVCILGGGNPKCLRYAIFRSHRVDRNFHSQELRVVKLLCMLQLHLYCWYECMKYRVFESSMVYMTEFWLNSCVSIDLTNQPLDHRSWSCYMLPWILYYICIFRMGLYAAEMMGISPNIM